MIAPAELHAAIDVDRVVERTQQLIRIPSVNPFQSGALEPNEGEAQVGDWLLANLRRLGFDAHCVDVVAGRPNVWGTSSGGDGPVIALVGHLDTVGVGGYEGYPFSGELVNGRVHGRGACDMKGALACFVEVAEVLEATGANLAGRLMIAGIADEEAGMLGSSSFGSHAPLPDMAIVGEPTEMSICTAHLGQFAVPIRTFGRAVHSSIATTGVNAIERMARVVAALGAHQADLAARAAHPLCGVGSVNAGVRARGRDWCRSCPTGASWRSIGESCRAKPPRTHGASSSRSCRSSPPAMTSSDGRSATRSSTRRRSTRRSSHPWSTLPASPLTLMVSDDQPGAFPGATDAPNLGVPAIILGPRFARPGTHDRRVHHRRTARDRNPPLSRRRVRTRGLSGLIPQVGNVHNPATVVSRGVEQSGSSSGS